MSDTEENPVEENPVEVNIKDSNESVIFNPMWVTIMRTLMRVPL